MKIQIYTDGAARGNPGDAGIGVAVYDADGKLLEEYCHYAGTATNNIAEYQALVSGLTLAKKYTPCSLCVFMDSELLVKQLNGLYRVKDQKLAVYYMKAKQILRNFESAVISHIPREKNKVADGLANKAIDNRIQPSKDVDGALRDETQLF